ncbi:DUF3710 domain-containing protein [Cellulomonas dongxiuzhuiae]|uniref:DUF3710 domain-containing protein n=1 Tax=Cellulomonas dongxiuzhuiae TaxID=2819979 RepID=A0ABX8GMY2_9CELL|nr:DUF3710 domain-containing protein [Cellulomonas dongxiuzhuiae]MBO3087341.1 DUF3710 domain-containing protein [Cellulomonas dongxiuzhuiae]MBO3093262.1 DUF3710 domain-containing protein [Cellulomonas dongxiuzhuiae]QWC17549.1 DUF3710 domain-containing protein [Cellulomonas dongxiuzhuiae]
MGLFRRGPKEGGASDTPADVPQDEEAAVAPGEELATGGEPGADARGPWDADGPFPAAPRVDLGAIQLPSLEGMEVRLEVDKATNVVSAVAVLLEGSSLQLQAFAAPRSEGIWDEIRDEIAASITQQGGTVDDLPGPFGRELLARLPVRTPEGRTGHRPARFIGSDGPRWFLRGVLTGRAAVEPDAAGTLEDLFSQVVVVRGSDARPPRDLLPLQLPGGATPPPPPADPRLAPPERGPEITEIG